MSEYWKSTPKYWCKHCKTFVRDTKLEKANHEATPKHQGNLKRFLRDLHRGHEKDEKDKERAKAEVARLSGTTTGGGAGSSSSSGHGRGFTPSLSKPKVTASQRKQQLAQLAEMGVSIPDEFRPDMAMAGEWEVTSQRIVDVEEGEKKPDAMALGVRKRAPDEDEAEEVEVKKMRWGSRYRTHPTEEDEADLEALLNNALPKGKATAIISEGAADLPRQEDDGIKKESEVERPMHNEVPPTGAFKDIGIKTEPSEGGAMLPLAVEGAVKQEGEDAGVGIVFKKRKAKNIRQK